MKFLKTVDSMGEKRTFDLHFSRKNVFTYIIGGFSIYLKLFKYAHFRY